MKLRTIVLTAVVALTGLPVLAAGQQAPAQQSRQAVAARGVGDIQGFHVVLVVGETQRGNGPGDQDLPAAAARALKDMSEFLPYKQYRVLDAQWTSCCSGSPTRIRGRLQGVIGVPAPNGAVNLVHRLYGFSIVAGATPSGIQTRFVLAAQGGHSSPHSEERAEVEKELKYAQDDLATQQSRARDVKSRFDQGLAPPEQLREADDRVTQARRNVERLQALVERAEAGGETSIMDSSFTMDAGETVVVGTSKLGGDKALIAVVTAVRKGGGAK
jgi:hypothetical protein